MIIRSSRGRPPGGPFPVPAAAMLATAIALGAAGSAVAHGPGGPSLAVEPAQVNPGGTIEVRGDNLGADEEVTVSLSAGSQTADLGVGTTDGEGHLAVFLAIPADIPAMSYDVLGRTASGSIARGTVTVAGAPVVDSDGGNPLERGPLGAVPAVASGAPPAFDRGAGSQQSAPVSTSHPGAGWDLVLLVAGLAVAAMLVGVPIARRARARPG